MNQDNAPIRVFISYSHDSKAHMDLVLELSNRLRHDGIDCELDQYEVSPPEGWPEWCRRQIHDVKFVLIVCTDIYLQRFERHAPEGEGTGVKWEGFIITQELYNRGGRNERFIPVVFTKDDRKFIPGLLKGASHYVLDSEDKYEALYRHLTNQPEVVKPDLGPIKPLPKRETRRDFLSTDASGEEPRIIKPKFSPIVVPDGMKYIGENQQGHNEFRWAEDDSVMIRIPAGKFWMGSAKDEGRGGEQPQHTVYLNEFYIDKYEVTNGQFDRFVEATGYETDAERLGSGIVLDNIRGWEHRTGVKWRTYHGSRTGNHPVVFVSWNDAVAYCKWAGKRLPTEAEWEKVARGTDGRRYPWGDKDPDDSRANFNGSKRGTTPVGSYPQGASAYGLLDMAGNVWEWCADWYDGTYYGRSPHKNPQGPSATNRRVNRGGSWLEFDPAQSLRCAYRDGDEPSIPCFHLGFRCAFSLQNINHQFQDKARQKMEVSR